MERGWINNKPNVEISPSCPRCGSTNTKFCYYNNYSLTQPRYFCKGCRRYWTKGGSLRNVPVGGGCRKNRRGKSLRLSSSSNSGSSNTCSDVAHYSKSLGINYNKGISSADESCNSSMISDGSHIDLALVYANFLNPQPIDHHSKISTTNTTTITTTAATNTGVEIQELGSDHFDPNLDFTTNMEAPLMYYCGVESTIKHQETIHHGLPPLPGEEVGSQEILWSNNSHQLNNLDDDHTHITLQMTQQPVLGPENDPQDPNNLLFGNWSPFDLSSDDTFSRT